MDWTYVEGTSEDIPVKDIYPMSRRLTGYTGFVRENVGSAIEVFHGSSAYLPFKKFDQRMIGSGLVTRGTRHGGFYFTTDRDNAEFYTEYFVLRATIRNVTRYVFGSSHPPTVLKKAIEDGRNYLIEDVLDGSSFSDIVVVPSTKVDDVQIEEWHFIGDKDFLYGKYDEFFGGADEDDDMVTQDMISETLSLIGADLDYLMNIPVFSEYYESKE